MDDIKDKAKKSTNYVKDKFKNSYRSLRMKYQGTKVYKNLDTLLKYQHIYYEMLNNELPVMQGGDRRKKAKKTQILKGGIMVTGFVFLFMYTRMGIINRILTALIATNSLIFFNKCHFYQQMVEECGQEMTLTGQEARILMRFYLPDHPNVPLWKQLCESYKDMSSQMQENRESHLMKDAEKKYKERKLDKEFANRLKDIDLESDISNSNSTNSDAKKFKQVEFVKKFLHYKVLNYQKRNYENVRIRRHSQKRQT